VKYGGGAAKIDFDRDGLAGGFFIEANGIRGEAAGGGNFEANGEAGGGVDDKGVRLAVLVRGKGGGNAKQEGEDPHYSQDTDSKRTIR